MRTNIVKNTTIIFAILLLALCFDCVNSYGLTSRNMLQVGQARPISQSLQIGLPLEREIKAGDSEIFSLNLMAGQFLALTVEQKGIDLLLTIIDPDEKELLIVNSPNGSYGSEHLYLIAPTSGNYTLKLSALASVLLKSNYSLVIKELRSATVDDQKLVKAEQLIATGLKLTSGSNADLRQAINSFQEALLLWQSTGQQVQIAYTLDYLGQAYDYVDEKQTAIDYYQQALKISQALQDPQISAILLNNLGLVYRSIKEFPEAANYYQAALAIVQKNDYLDLEIAILHNLASLAVATDASKQAITYYQQLLPLLERTNNHNDLGQVLYTLGQRCLLLLERSQAINYLEMAATAFHTANNFAGEIAVLNSIGLIYRTQGNKEQAVNYYSQALTLAKAKNDSLATSATLIGLGALSDAIGEKQQALNYYEQVLPLAAASHNERLSATLFNNLGLIYKSLGENQQANNYYQQALLKARASSDRKNEATILHNLANCFDLPEENKEVLDSLEQALKLERELKDHNGEIYTLSALGSVKYRLGAQPEALEYQQQALKLAVAYHNRRGEALAFNGLGLSYQALEQPTQALNYLNQALPNWRLMNDHSGIAVTLYNIAQIERNNGNYKEALVQIKLAIAEVEAIRARVVNQNLRATFFASVQDFYELYIDVLMRLQEKDSTANYQSQALEVSEQARARSLVEMLAEANADIRSGITPELRERERKLQQQINTCEQNRLNLFFAEQSQKEIDIANEESDKLLLEYQRLETEIRLKSPRYAALTQPQHLTLAEIQAQLTDDTMLLEYYLGNERSYLWVVTKTNLKSFILPKQSKIDEIAQSLYLLLIERSTAIDQVKIGKITTEQYATLVKQADAKYPELAAQLSELILKPATQELTKPRILVVGDGALQYIPFNILTDPSTLVNSQPGQFGQPLIVNHEIVNLPSISALVELRRNSASHPRAPKLVAMLADPIFEESDERIKEIKLKVTNNSSNVTTTPAPSNLTETTKRELIHPANGTTLTDKYLKIVRLPYTAEEARQITSLVAEKDTLKALGLMANRAIATSTELSQYQYVHFATHGYLDPDRPELSALLLSFYNEKGEGQDGFLRMHEIFNLNLPAEMVVLSACETGLGKEIKGEGIVGLTRSFMYAGAMRVVVSLWNINDKATAELMARFYQKVITQKMRPAAALRAAQLELLENTKYQAPYYWAAFTLQGEWQ